MSKEMAFVVCCLENYRTHRELTGKEAVGLFQMHGVFSYLRDFYDVLHTSGYQYINDDIDKYLIARGVQLG